MPYKDPEKQKAAKRASAQRARQRQGRQRVAVAVAEAGLVEHVLPEPPERDELVRLLGIQARSGSVRAIELMLKMEAPVADANTDPLDGLDELAAKRAIRA